MLKRLLLAVFVTALLAGGVAAQDVMKSDIPGLNHYVLDNGLEVFILENHVVPLTTVQITFRCGAIAQEPKTAGLFHLYEHMLFKGNKDYPNQAAFAAAMKQLGVGNWNGGTSTEYVTYYFTIPSDKTDKGVNFWASAVQYPLFNEAEFAKEKEVVTNEIMGYHTDPGDQYSSAVTDTLFGTYPWRRDVSGSVDNIAGATIADMKGIQKGFYIPNNAALFIAGDVNPETVLEQVKAAFGGWERGPDPWAEPLKTHPLMDKNSFLVLKDASMHPAYTLVEVKLRGPEVLDDPASTYAADVLITLLDDPAGRFKSSIFNKVPGLYAQEYIGLNYFTQRDGGVITISTYMLIDNSVETLDRAKLFAETAISELKTMAADPDYFNPEAYTAFKTILGDQALYEQEVPVSFISTLSFWWAVASTDYYYGYVPNMKKVTHAEISSYLNAYVTGKPYIVSLRMNPASFKDGEIERNGFTEIQPETAYWWSKE